MRTCCCRGISRINATLKTLAGVAPLALFGLLAFNGHARSEIIGPSASISFSKTVKTVNGQKMTVWSKPGGGSGASRVASAGGFLWFVETKTGKIFRFGTSGAAAVFDMPERNTKVKSIARGPEGTVWFVGYNRKRVGRVSIGGNIQLYTAAQAKPKSVDMTLGLDSSTWFVSQAGRIGRITDNGKTALFSNKAKSKKPSAITVGGDGNLWFLQQTPKRYKNRNKLSNVTRMTTSGNLKSFPTKSGLLGGFGIATGPKGRIWYTDTEKNRIGRMNTNGAQRVYFKKGVKGGPISIAAANNNKMYYGGKWGQIGEVSMSGTTRMFPIPGGQGKKAFKAQGIASGPDGNIWFVNARRTQIGQLNLQRAQVDCTGDVWSNLQACGWPAPGNTGYSGGKQLRSTSGRTITRDGTVIDGEKVNGTLVIAAKNVTVRNSWIISSRNGNSGTGVIEISPGASATITRTTLDGSNATHAGIFYAGTKLVARGNNITRVNDGIFSWDGDHFRIEDNYLHDFSTDAANGHVDGFQTEGASHGIIRHNVFDVAQDQTSAIAIWNSRRDSRDILIENNLLLGGGFTIYAHDYHPSDANPQGGYVVSNIRILNNKFSNARYDCVGNYGVWYPRGAPSDEWRRAGNVLLETGQDLDFQNPIVNGWECR